MLAITLFIKLWAKLVIPIKKKFSKEWVVVVSSLLTPDPNQPKVVPSQKGMCNLLAHILAKELTTLLCHQGYEISVYIEKLIK